MPPETQQIYSSTTTRSSAPTLISSEHPSRPSHTLGSLFTVWCKQSFQVFAWPSPATFATQQGKTDWRLVLILLFGWTGVAALLASVAQPLSPSFLTFINLPAWLQQASIHPMAIAIATFLELPLAFLLWMGLLYVLARAVRGQGTFFTQLSTTLLFQVPLGLLSSMLLLVPFGAGLSITVLGYALLLHVFMLMAVHHLSGSKATMIVFVPVLLLVVLLVTFTLTFVGGMLLFGLLGAYLLLLWEFS